ncbi:cytochrome p450 [Holotrichia oblita]|uniref:Cytochrome p450 n=1 Tax=Holotrichia oblita TaxID=644536 RepID=A0ACB9SXH2_HOLOL|nr:cytochrome p450 [Holotrichia oblita]
MRIIIVLSVNISYHIFIYKNKSHYIGSQFHGVLIISIVRNMFSLVELFIIVLISLVIATLLYFRSAHSYWKKRNVNYIEPTFPWGNLENPLFLKRGVIGIVQDAYKQFKSKQKRFGGIYFFHKPMLIPVDLQLIKNILTKDFSHFVNHGSLSDEENEPMTANLFNAEDDKWRNLRTKLTPTFTSAKMKLMFSMIEKCSYQMIDHIRFSCLQKKPLHVKEIVSCYTTDVIGSCVFGLDCNSFKNPDAEFRKYGKKATEISVIGSLRLFILFIMPEINRILRIRLLDKDVSDFFTRAFKDVLNSRKIEDTARKDFVQLLLEMSPGHVEASKSLTVDEMVAQAFVFFIAGFDTSASNLAFCLYELAMHQTYQDRLRQEILEVLGRHDQQLTYEAIAEMKYMDQVIDETLRFFPPLPFLSRKCSKNYPIPNSDLIVEQGSTVVISVLGLHMDEEYYPNPEVFDPDRFSKENKAKRSQYVHIPFGEGPRICIGELFVKFLHYKCTIGTCLLY